MRKRFEQQYSLGRLRIEDTPIPIQKRSGKLPELCAALKKIFISPEMNGKIFDILEKNISSDKQNTGRPGMNLWQIFVLAQVRLCMNISYDELYDLSNHHTMIRQIMGIESDFGHEKVKFSYRSIIDNVGLLDDQMVKEINDIIVEFGHLVFKKKEDTALHLKTDSFVVESNVHFPTDYNLLWDSARKSIDMVTKFQKKYHLEGWRKIKNWRKDLKNKMRALGQASTSGGQGKQERLKTSAQAYLTKAKALYLKLDNSKNSFPQLDIVDLIIFMELERFLQLLQKHIDLLERRIIKGEEIPHSEKMFSIFEDYTEWVKKGKMRPNVELGKKVAITTDQYHLIIDYKIMEHQADSEIVKCLSENITRNHRVASWSFDKGFWHKDNKAFLADKVEKVIMPKKGKCNKKEAEEEKQPLFKKLKNKHSAVESNINELEQRGLNRCPDKGYRHFKRYVGLAICAYNLRKIGAELITQEIKAREKLQQAA
ncbi:MAG TPA: ISNCY family transposase [Draconibacterium sp.]|nr:ISNCY family transposase [Draconibacterium sp.]